MMKILILTRKYPPKKGGMEKQSFELIRNIKSNLKKDLDYIYLNKNQINLFWWIPLTFIKSLFLIKKKNHDIIHLCDGLLSPVGFLLKKLTNKKVTVTIHGLDIIYKKKIYQSIIPFCVKNLDKVFCVSKNTANICISKGIDPKKIIVIPNGINPNELKIEIKNPKELLSKKIDYNLENRKVITTVGRLVKRKGVSWFIKEVFPKLKNQNIVYLIVGSGEEEKNIKQNINQDILLLGSINEDFLKLVYNSTDCFVMPNIPIKGDVEGFGIVAIEASSLGIPVVASKIDGIKEAVIENKNGFLVKPKDKEIFTKKIIEAINFNNKRKKEIKEFTEKNFSWKQVSQKYINAFRQLIF